MNLQKEPWEMTFEEWRKTHPLYGEGLYWRAFKRSIMAKASFEEAVKAAVRRRVEVQP